MKYTKNKAEFTLLLLSMLLYVGMPYVVFGARISSQTKKVASASTVKYLPQTKSITYFYGGGTLMNAEDDNGDMSSYLNRTVRTIIDVKNKAVVDSQCLFTDGKNVISQTDSTGTDVEKTQQYNAFGVVVNFEKPANAPKANSHALTIADNPFAYDGYYSDPESNLYYLNARYYSPTLMQFISMDTYDLANRYGYCDGNPIGNEDPTGHSVIGGLGDFGIRSLAEGFVPGWGPYVAYENNEKGVFIATAILDAISVLGMCGIAYKAIERRAVKNASNNLEEFLLKENEYSSLKRQDSIHQQEIENKENVATLPNVITIMKGGGIAYLSDVGVSTVHMFDVDGTIIKELDKNYFQDRSTTCQTN